MNRVDELKGCRAGIRLMLSDDAPEQFHLLLEQAMRLLSLTDDDIARHFDVSRPTVTRWRNGKARPHAYARPMVYKLIDKRLSLAIGAGSSRPEPAKTYPAASDPAPAPVVMVARGQ